MFCSAYDAAYNLVLGLSIACWILLFFRGHVSPSHQTLANLRFGLVSAVIGPAEPVIEYSSQFLDDSLRRAERYQSRDAQRHSRGVLPGSLVQSNSPAWGDAQQGGNRLVWGSATFASRWVGISSITLGSSIRRESAQHYRRRGRSQCRYRKPASGAAPGNRSPEFDSQSPSVSGSRTATAE